MFNCTKCGLCCQNLHLSPLEELKKMHSGNGICYFLDPNKKSCTIYNDRPLICQIDGFYKKNLTDVLTKQEFYQLNEEFCLKLQEES